MILPVCALIGPSTGTQEPCQGFIPEETDSLCYRDQKLPVALWLWVEFKSPSPTHVCILATHTFYYNVFLLKEKSAVIHTAKPKD